MDETIGLKERIRDAIRDIRNRNIHLTEVSRIMKSYLTNFKSILKVTHIEYLYEPTSFQNLNFRSTLHAKGILKCQIGKNYDRINVFIKFSPHLLMPFTSNQRITTDVIKRFEKEIYIYTKILPDFGGFQQSLTDQKKGHLLGNNRLFNSYLFIKNIFPMCYGVRSALSADVEQEYPSKAGVIILEDLSEDGFVPFDPREPLPFDVMRAVLTKMASFHAVSFLFDFHHHTKSLSIKSWCYVSNIQEAFCFSNNHFKYVIEHIKLIPELTNYQEFLTDKLYYSLIHGPDKPEGDCKLNMRVIGLTFGSLIPQNIMIKKDQDGKLIDCRLIDCQHMQMRHLLSDLAMILITWCHPTLLNPDENEYRLLMHDYFLCLEMSLRRLFNIPFKFNWQLTLKELKFVIQKDLLRGLTFLKYLSVKKEFVEDMRTLASWPNFKPLDIENKMDKELYLKKLKDACLGLIRTNLICDAPLPSNLSKLVDIDSRAGSSQKSKDKPIEKLGQLKAKLSPKVGSSQEPEAAPSQKYQASKTKLIKGQKLRLSKGLEAGPIQKLKAKPSPEPKARPSQEPKAGSSQESKVGPSQKPTPGQAQTTPSPEPKAGPSQPIAGDDIYCFGPIDERSQQLFEALEKIRNLSKSESDSKIDFRKLSSESIVSQMERSKSPIASLDFSLGSSSSTSKQFAVDNETSDLQEQLPLITEKASEIAAKLWARPSDGGVYAGPSTSTTFKNVSGQLSKSCSETDESFVKLPGTRAIEEEANADLKKKTSPQEERVEPWMEFVPENKRLVELIQELAAAGQQYYTYRQKLLFYLIKTNVALQKTEKLYLEMMRIINVLKNTKVEISEYDIVEDSSDADISTDGEFEESTLPSPGPSSESFDLF